VRPAALAVPAAEGPEARGAWLAPVRVQALARVPAMAWAQAMAWDRAPGAA